MVVAGSTVFDLKTNPVISNWKILRFVQESCALTFPCVKKVECLPSARLTFQFRNWLLTSSLQVCGPPWSPALESTHHQNNAAASKQLRRWSFTVPVVKTNRRSAAGWKPSIEFSSHWTGRLVLSNKVISEGERDRYDSVQLGRPTLSNLSWRLIFHRQAVFCRWSMATKVDWIRNFQDQNIFCDAIFFFTSMKWSKHPRGSSRSI